MLRQYDGKDSEKRFEPRKLCPHCGKTGAYYLGSEVLYRNSSSQITEARDYYLCARPDCQREWSERGS